MRKFGGSVLAALVCCLLLVSADALGALAVGNRVQVTAVTNIRSCASTSCSILGEAPVNSLGMIIGGPTSANGFTWWQVDWDSLPTGWSIQSNITQVLVPTVSSISPTSMIADGLPHSLTINGSNFQAGNVVQFKWGVGAGAGVWNTSNSTPTVNSSSRITLNMNPGNVTDTIFVRVCRSSSATNSADCSSGNQSVAVTAPVPVPSVTSVNPTSMIADGVAHSLTINGSNFQAGNVVQFKWGVGSGAGIWTTGNSPPTINSSTRITIDMNPGTNTDTIFVRVCRSSNATNNSDCSSGNQSVAVTAPVPAPFVSSISPTTMPADNAQHLLTINGSSFQSGNVVQFKWGAGTGAGVWTNSIGVPSIVSPTLISVSMNPGQLNDTIFVRVCRSTSATNPADCSSGTHAITVIATPLVPVVTSVSPTSMPADGTFHPLTINGSSFQAGNVVQLKWGVGAGSGVWNLGETPVVVSSILMTVNINTRTSNDTILVRVCRSSSATASGDCSSGTHSVVVSVPGPGPAPVVSSISPTTMPADGALHPLSITGSNFQSGNVVQLKWGVGSGAGVWNTGQAPTVNSASSISVNVNSRTANDTIFVRVCRSSGATTTGDCSSGTASIVVSLAPPALPGSFTITGFGHCNARFPAISLNWSASSGATSYSIYRNLRRHANVGSSTTYESTGSVFAGWSYDYYAVASNSAGSTRSNTIRVGVPDNVCEGNVPPHWVALGDSFSSGEGAGPFRIDRNGDLDYNDPGEDTDISTCANPSSSSTCAIWQRNLCHRSTKAYSQDLAYSSTTGYPAVNASVFHACSGAETVNVFPSSSLGIPQHDYDGWPYLPTDDITQLDHSDIGDAEMITLSIGGNDAKFGMILTMCFKKFDCRTTPMGFGESATTLEEYIEDEITSNVKNSVKLALIRTRARASVATIYLLGYPKLFPPSETSSACNNPLFNGSGLFAWSPDEQIWMNKVADTLNLTLERVVLELDDPRVKFVPMYRVGSSQDNGHFETHEICGAAESYFNFPSRPVELFLRSRRQLLFHPNEAGYKEGYRRTLMEFLREHPPLIASPPPAIDNPQDSKEDHDEFLHRGPSSLPTLGELLVKSAARCQKDGFARNQQVIVSGADFAPFQPVAMKLSTESGTFDLPSVVADSAGAFQVSVTFPASVGTHEYATLEGYGTGSNGLYRRAMASFGIGPNSGTDSDLDGVEDACDLCPNHADANQSDQDRDGAGDACDLCPLDAGDDGDADGLCDSDDPCPLDPTNNADGDGLCGGGDDNCSLTYNPGQEDSDNDLVGDVCDAFPGALDTWGIFRDGFESGGTCEWSETVGANSCTFPQNGRSAALVAAKSQSFAISDSAQSGLDITGDLTLEFWMNPATSPGNFELVGKYSESANQRSYGLQYLINDGASTLSFTLSSNCTTEVQANWLLFFTPGAWHHLAVVYSASAGRAELFVGGVSQGIRTGLPTSLCNGGAEFSVGQRENSRYFNGLLDDIRVWNLARAQSQILADMSKQIACNATGLVAYWRMNSDSSDCTASANHLLPSNNPSFSSQVPF